MKLILLLFVLLLLVVCEPPVEWTCDKALYDAKDGCHCQCGAPDPDCGDKDATLIGCGKNDAFCNSQGNCDGWKPDPPPAEWTCGDNRYGTFDGCDCECGAYDPDCNNPKHMQHLKNCPFDGNYFCNKTNQCEKVVFDESKVPDKWWCAKSSFGTFDGCHCECGAYDPFVSPFEYISLTDLLIDKNSDCHDDKQQLFGCGPDAKFCDMEGHCQYGEKKEEFHDIKWYCPFEQFGGLDGCHCECGDFDIDCYYPNQTIIGCNPGDYCDWSGKCTTSKIEIHPPPEWTCEKTKFADGEICNCGCGAGDPDCFFINSTIVGCPNATDKCDKEGKCFDPDQKRMDDVPDGWFCPKENYGSGDACHCACGAYDPDCDDKNLEVKNCMSDQFCGFDGWCKHGGTSYVPNEWHCEHKKYGNWDGCHCNCGARDPDCDDMYQAILGCPPEHFCDHSGQCKQETTKQVPPSWYCAKEAFGGQDGCDCNCGGYDPDCNTPGVEIKNCNPGVIKCGMYGECVYEADKYIDVPSSWWCPKEFYNNDDSCDCNCGAYDPDCDKPSSVLTGCPPGAGFCSAGGTCAYGIPPNWKCDASKYGDEKTCDCGCGAYDIDCEPWRNLPVVGCGDKADMICGEKGECKKKPPAGWFCPVDMYNNGGGCDCSCGAYDPDCDDKNLPLFGCGPDASGCGSDGKCQYPAGKERNIPAGWKCMESSFDGMDGCHCECGAYDPDCDPSKNMQLFGCGPDAYGCGQDGHCLKYNNEEFDHVPSEWWCDPNSFNAYDGCHCECGAYDKDCDQPWQTLLGCGKDAKGCDWKGHCIYPNDDGGGDGDGDGTWAPDEWTCDKKHWGSADGCHCGCGVYDPDCDWGYAIQGCPDGVAIGCDLFGKCIYGAASEDKVPQEWWCDPKSYGKDNYCDCNCGAYDPDCQKPGSILMNCPSGATQCDMAGYCAYGIPRNYMCKKETFDAGDGCNCGCGAYDPDCKKPDQKVIGCNPGELCDETGKCIAKNVPDGWHCPISWYGSDGACDCDCGAFDPDCIANENKDGTDEVMLNGCQPGAIGCDYNGKCKYPDTFENKVPPEWKCWESHFGTKDGCHCDCGVYDPDCDTQANQLYFCPKTAIGCDKQGKCILETVSSGDAGKVVPEEWDCKISHFDSKDGCHCECGAFDPDCVDTTAIIYGCPEGTTACSKEGKCMYSDGGGGAKEAEEEEGGEKTVVPNSWTCHEEYYGKGDDCDCKCGTYDPDCSNTNAKIWGCDRGVVSCSSTGTCVYGEVTNNSTVDKDVPKSWTCGAQYYDNNDGCDCNCGAYDPDCDDRTGEIVGCAKDDLGCDPDGECIKPDFVDDSAIVMTLSLVVVLFIAFLF